MRSVEPLTPDLYRLRSGVDALLSAELISETRTLDSDAAARRRREPALIVGCSDGKRPAGARQYADHWGGPSRLVIVPDSDHTFSREGNLEGLLGVTIEWLETVSPS
jgi:hypothetical protein